MKCLDESFETLMIVMALSLLIDKDMKKKDILAAVGISSSSVTKLAKKENISTEILQKVCAILNCGISDIFAIIKKKHRDLKSQLMTGKIGANMNFTLF